MILIVYWGKQTFFFSYDSLTLYDGGLSTSTMVGKYCGDSIISSYVSSSNEILIHFQSDYSVAYTGFQMEYNPISNCPGDSTCSNQGTCDMSNGTCVCDSGFQGDVCQGKNFL